MCVSLSSPLIFCTFSIFCSSLSPLLHTFSFSSFLFSSLFPFSVTLKWIYIVFVVQHPCTILPSNWQICVIYINRNMHIFLLMNQQSPTLSLCCTWWGWPNPLKIKINMEEVLTQKQRMSNSSSHSDWYSVGRDPSHTNQTQSQECCLCQKDTLFFEMVSKLVEH